MKISVSTIAFILAMKEKQDMNPRSIYKSNKQDTKQYS